MNIDGIKMGSRDLLFSGLCRKSVRLVEADSHTGNKQIAEYGYSSKQTVFTYQLYYP